MKPNPKSNHIQHLINNFENDTVGSLNDLQTSDDYIFYHLPKSKNDKLKTYHSKK
jgi:hypothetical protein